MAQAAGKDESPLEKLHRWAREDFGNIALDIVPLCLSDCGTEPICFHHFPIAEASTQLRVTEQERDSLHRGYTYLAAFYFCVDSIIDSHPRTATHEDPIRRTSPYLGSLLVAGFRHILEPLNSRGLTEWGAKHLHDLLVENAWALKCESAVLSESENRACIIGRANVFPFIFELCSEIQGGCCSKDLIELAESYLYLVQLGDDIGDWREDFLANRTTSFLRSLSQQFTQAVVSIDQLDRLIYLDGEYERSVAKVIREFDKLIERCSHLDFDALGDCCRRARLNIFRALQDFVTKKLEISGCIAK